MLYQIAVASANPAKIEAVKLCFIEWLLSVDPRIQVSVQGFATRSGVSAQPLNSAETLQGAHNRLAHLEQLVKADFYVSIEAGLDDALTFAWILIKHQGHLGMSRSASLMLPPAALALIEQGMELGDAMDKLYGTANIKQAGGAIGLLTENRLSRSSVYQQALTLALIPFFPLFPKLTATQC